MKAVREGITLHHGLISTEHKAAAALYWQAFGGKLGRVMGPEPLALNFVERVIAPGFALGARDRFGALVGVIGFRTQHGSFVGGGWPDLRACYGPVGGAWRAGCLRLLAHDLPPGTMMVDGIAVHRDARGQGVGTALIEELTRLAQSLGYRALCLEVVDENLRARALYERLGFAPIGVRRSMLTRMAFTFHRVHILSRAL